jgi:hypothetical protein
MWRKNESGDYMTSARQELEQFAALYRSADEDEKAAKAEKEQLRPAILALVSEVVREEVPLSSKKIYIPIGQDAREFVQKQHPGWIVIQIEVDSDLDRLAVTIQEDPDLVKFEFEFDGMRFGRTVSAKRPTFDAERLWQERQDLRSLVREETTTTYSLDETKASRAMVDDPSLMDTFRDYWDIPAPEPRLLPITPIKDV